MTSHHFLNDGVQCVRVPTAGIYIVDGFVILAAWCIVGCLAAKQTRKKHMAHVETVFALVGFFSRSGALKAANLHQCMGTAEDSPMWLGDEWAYSRE